ncbi:Uncharacterized protein PECH_000617 [Penicillium ucsense]|uniref:WW-domain-binding protein n=1 Tax=Penicillium ucsense TaxID=2839758 RepID=A0A8J8WGQ1_9EURO|nr:Uncharacterized protein PECM_000673 [Penicillium ucsense]KAF7738352.1 Uncharacterized protein PECH_000617 [Penicillium ucsense]
MSINWVMLHEQDGFVRLPNERMVYTSPPRARLALTPPPGYTGRDDFSHSIPAGNIYLTNQRVVYLPESNTATFQSFSAPLLNVRDSHVSAPFFGPNVWTALVQPVAGGGFPPSLPAIQVKVTFKEGGAFDFHTNFERIRERLEQAVENIGDAGRGMQGVDLSAVHLDELPAYDGPQASAPPLVDDALSARPQHTRQPSTSGAEPAEPPPCYEEVQSQSVAQELEERLRRAG